MLVDMRYKLKKWRKKQSKLDNKILNNSEFLTQSTLVHKSVLAKVLQPPNNKNCEMMYASWNTGV